MEFNYIDYQDELFSTAISNRPAVYIFDNFENLTKAREYYSKPFLEQQSIFIVFNDLKEKLFPTDKLILKEEKLAIILYDLLTVDEKNKLKIDNYFDVIELAAAFYHFFDELAEYNIAKIDDLRDWQQEKYKLIQSIRRRYLDKLEELNYTDKTLAFNLENFKLDYFIDYQSFVFVNVLNFSPKERRLLKLLEDAGKEVTLYLQVAPEDFDEINPGLKSVTLPDLIQTDIKLYNTEEDLLQIINLISQIEDKPVDYNILDADFNNRNYHKLISANRIKIKKEIGFTETRIFRFLEGLYNLYINADKTRSDLRLEMDSLLEASYLDEFQQYYQITESDLKKLQQLSADDFAYFSVELPLTHDNFYSKYQQILTDIKTIGQLKNLNQFCEFLENLDLGILNDKNLETNIAQFFDALLEIHSIEEMGLVTSWNKYFSDRAGGLFQLIINYLRFKKVKPLQIDEATVELTDLLTAVHKHRAQLIILNASQGVIPSEPGNGFLLTEKQRRKLGLKTTSEHRLLEKYYFYRHILSCNQVEIYSLKNQEANLTTSSFVDELRLKYELENQEMEIKPSAYHEVIKGIFETNHRRFKEKIAQVKFSEDKLAIEPADFPKIAFSLTYYKYQTLKDCYYKFYLEEIANLKEERISLNKDLSPRVLGIIVHDILTTLIDQSGLESVIPADKVKQLIEQKFKNYDLKIHNYYRKYYQDILFNRVKDSILYFYDLINIRISGEIKEVLTEMKPVNLDLSPIYQDEMTSFLLNGRLDLVIKSTDMTYLIDFKTGSGSLEQLDFYSLLLKPENQLEKAIYSVMDLKYLAGHSGSESEFAEELMTEVSDFMKGQEYSKIYKSRCQNCKMIEICKVVNK